MDLSASCLNLLASLSCSEDGLSANILDISTGDFLFLSDLGYIKEPGGKIIGSGSERFVVHSGHIFLTPQGMSALISARKAKKKTIGEWVRWSVTTAVAVAALVISIISLLMQNE